MIALLKLRVLQGFRILREIGLLLIVVALFACASFLFALFVGLRDSPPIDIVLLAGMVTVFVDFLRKDKHFLLVLFGNRQKVRAYLSIEYLFLSLPFTVFLLGRQAYLPAAYLLASIPILSFILPYRLRFAKQVVKRSISFIPLRFFEIKFFIEQRPILAGIILILLFGGMVHISFWILGMVFIAASLTEVFKRLEPRMMIQESFKKRLFDYLIFFQGLLLLPTLSNLVVFPQYYLVYIYGWISLGIALVLLISYKYANYTGLREELFSSNMPGIFVLLSLLPGFVLVTGVAAFYYYLKAKKNMAYVGA